MAVQEFSAAPPDLLVLDIGLPDADGRDVCQALRAHGVDAPVIFLTARGAADRPAVGLPRGRRRLPDQAVRARRADRARPRAAQAPRAPSAPRARRAAAGSRRRTACAGRRAHRVADADRVPPAGRARRPARARSCAGASWSPPPGRTARSCTRTRSTPTSAGCGASCARSSAEAADRDRARRRLRAAVSLRAPRHARHGRRRSASGWRSSAIALNLLLANRLSADAVLGAREPRRRAAGDARHERGALRDPRRRRRRRARRAGLGVRRARPRDRALAGQRRGSTRAVEALSARAARRPSVDPTEHVARCSRAGDRWTAARRDRGGRRLARPLRAHRAPGRARHARARRCSCSRPARCSPAARSAPRCGRWPT